MTFAPCATCRGPAEVDRKIGGGVTLRHVCLDHDLAIPFANEERAAATWGLTYARQVLSPACPAKEDAHAE